MCSEVQEFDEFSFINSCLEGGISESLSVETEQKIKSVLRFAIFWNLLEADPWFKNYVSLWKLENSDLHTRIINNLSEEEKSSLNYCIFFFSERYHIWNDYNLGCRDYEDSKWGEYQGKLQEIKEEQDETTKQQLIQKNMKEYLKICLFIVYRLRNNLFHGIKQLSDLSQQNKLFNVVNRFLSLIIASLRKFYNTHGWLSS